MWRELFGRRGTGRATNDPEEPRLGVGSRGRGPGRPGRRGDRTPSQGRRGIAGGRGEQGRDNSRRGARGEGRESRPSVHKSITTVKSKYARAEFARPRREVVEAPGWMADQQVAETRVSPGRHRPSRRSAGFRPCVRLALRCVHCPARNCLNVFTSAADVFTFPAEVSTVKRRGADRARVRPRVGADVLSLASAGSDRLRTGSSGTPGRRLGQVQHERSGGSPRSEAEGQGPAPPWRTGVGRVRACDASGTSDAGGDGVV